MTYRPLRDAELRALGDIEGFSVPAWTGPALTAPAGADAIREVMQVVNRLLQRGQSLVQAQDGLTGLYTLNGVTDTAEHFMLGSEWHVERGAAIRALAVAVEAALRRLGLENELLTHGLPDLARWAEAATRWLPGRLFHRAHSPAPAPGGAYSTLPLEDMRQFAMGWTNLGDIYRTAYPRLDEFVAAATDPVVASAQFWPSLSRTALPYNLLVLRRLETATAEPFRTHFGAAWTAAFETMLEEGRLYGIDMTVFAGLTPLAMADGTTRFTPCTMILLEMGADHTVLPVAALVMDPADSSHAETYTPQSPAWMYALLAVRVSLTVHGIWLGHVFPLHLVTAAMQMTMWNTLPEDHILRQALAPQSHDAMAFNFLLLVGWDELAPPTSVGNAGVFLGLAERYAVTHDYFSNDPGTALASLGLDGAVFAKPGEAPWSAYPIAQLMLRVWDMVETYVRGVIDAGYASDSDVAHDRYLAAWMSAAASRDGGNVAGLPRVQTKAMLVRVVTSLLYRIVFHGMGKLRSISNPEPSFVPNFPPCLQSTRIPRADQPVTTQDLLREFLPKAGTLGELITFYDLFAFTPPSVPLVPPRGPAQDLFFDDRYESANQALTAFRQAAANLVAELQPDWVQVGQWPMNIEF
jgi:hypothetical protein